VFLSSFSDLLKKVFGDYQKSPTPLTHSCIWKTQKVAHPAKPSTWWGEHNSSYISISSGPSDGTMDCRVESARPALRGAAAVTLATWQGNVVAGSLPWMSSL